MPELHWRGPTIPSAGDDLLAAWPQFLNTSGIIGQADNPATIDVILASAPAGAVTPTHPAYFDVSGIIWRADGTKSDGAWVKQPINANERATDTFAGPGATTVAADAFTLLETSTLGVRPYPRAVTIRASAFGQGISGKTDLAVRVRGVTIARSRFDTGDEQSNVVIADAEIPAGSDPQITMGIQGGPGGGQVGVYGNQLFNQLSVTAVPIATV